MKNSQKYGKIKQVKKQTEETNMYRTKNCGELNLKDVGEEVELARMDTKNKKPRRHDIY